MSEPTRAKTVLNLAPDTRADLEASARALDDISMAYLVTKEHDLLRALAAVGIRNDITLLVEGVPTHLILPFDLSKLPSTQTTTE